MALIVSCGLPGMSMPAWFEGAYSEVECYGMPLGTRPETGLNITGIFTAEEIQALIDYIFATFVPTPQQ